MLAHLHRVDLDAVSKDESIPEAVERVIEAVISDHQSGWVRTRQAVQREIQVLRRRYGLLGRETPMTYDELGAELGVSRTRIYHMLDRTLRRMRHPKYLTSLYQFVASEEQSSRDK